MLLLSLLIFSGCSSIKVHNQDSRDYISQKRGDILTTGKLSSMTINNLQLAGITANQCRFNNLPCINALMAFERAFDEQTLAALSELWLQRAIMLSADYELSRYERDAQLNAYLEAARFAYGYLFLTDRSPSQRTFEDRQFQVRDYYNFATQQITLSLFDHYRDSVSITEPNEFEFIIVNWQIKGRLDETRLAAGQRLPDAIQAASSLRLSGLRNEYKLHGLGAGLVAIVNNTEIRQDPRPWSETPFSPLTSLTLFEATDLTSLLRTQTVYLRSFDPYQTTDINISGYSLPLEADFTTPYALWLANSKFVSQPLLTLVGLDKTLQEPHIFMMQPYDPNRKIIVMLHGLASSPQAWVNLANEILGDPLLREHYQIWQVYYPTSAPLMFNRHAIKYAIEDAVNYFDPNRIYPASTDMVLVGHSMGGVLARLLVSDSPDENWDNWIAQYSLDKTRAKLAEAEFKSLFSFEALPNIGRVIFIASPHQGTPFASQAWVRRVSQFVTLPITLIGKTTELVSLLSRPDDQSDTTLTRSLNSIDNLSEDNPFLRMTTALAITANLPYHSIIGQEDPNLALEQSSNGVVPYQSSHLPGRSVRKSYYWRPQYSRNA